MIRRANETDVPQINDLLKQVLSVHNSGRPDIFKSVGQKYTEEELKAIINNDETPVFVFEDENQKVLGHCFCQVFVKEESNNTYAYKNLYIDDLCIDEQSRNKRVGKRLYEYVKNYAKENGFYNITLHAWECNPNAVEFYKHLGLKVQQYTMEEIL